MKYPDMMARRSSRKPDATKVARVVSAAIDLAPENVDRLYGLEPLYEPGASAGVTALPFVELQCPFCGETIGTTVDVTGGSRSYIEDCQVCCRPMDIHIECGADGNLSAAWTQRCD